MQDIAGCRVVVADIQEQGRFVELLKSDFPTQRVEDRRKKPSHGYRAVHVIVQSAGKSVEIQVRTMLQHLWAQVSEKAADVLDPAVKYGGGPKWVRDLLTLSSQFIGRLEALKQQLTTPNQSLVEAEAMFTEIMTLAALEFERMKRPNE
jgi:ppGpp synthetase/RelA/SpoT-type nucleotidyltranferase